MEVQFHLPLALFFSFLGLLSFSSSAHAYDEYSHEWITRSAFSYLKEYPHVYPETQKWLENNGPKDSYLEEILVRSDVDTDYRADLYMSAWFHNSIDGAVNSQGILAMFTTMFHFLTVTYPGRYWAYDGYSYAANSRHGNDAYLNAPTLRVSGKTSSALGGQAPNGHPNHGAVMGVYSLGFKGTPKQWKQMFFKGFASEAYFPPSYVPAEIAYQKMIESPRATTDAAESWTETQHLVNGIFSNESLKHDYWRGEAAGLPRFFDSIGMIMHLVQDATVPQHVEDTSDRCHPEYEREVDQLACGSRALDYRRYYTGDFGGMTGVRCDSIYDPALVNKILADDQLLDPSHPLSVQDRLIQAAQLTSAWNWRVKTPKKYAALFPDGTLLSADTCQELVTEKEVEHQAKFQFNLAVAETVAVFETAAHDYETQHPGQEAPAPAALLSWFSGSN